MKYSFENLEVWQKSRILVQSIYKLTASFPSDEKYGLSTQLRRASVSISSNIAEGSTRWSKKDQARFYEIAFGSLIEVRNQLILSNDLKHIDDKQLNDLREQIETIGRMLNALHKSQNKPINKSTSQPINN
ncbi:MAG: four helix bundle protein [Bacteroidetes bacterium GWF2_33_38]|nr:MAG: four helix bundle protein [Bacteroidetes bacterium GWF2_33_38]OFY74533.1 MAG: four helix bundle protein [Bacteroidetes bacterium RIFOXYA12_FULL_33_9]OFY88866.1 MAG: four helix bundle protein [Bacteroidetes bacterium RIFOXYA2_FULL_33_7]